MGNDLPTVSCSASQCAVALNYALLDNPEQNAYQAFLVHLRHGMLDGSGWTAGLRVSSLSCGTDRFCWAIVTTSEGSSGAQLARIDSGVVGAPGALTVPASSVACWSVTCVVVGNDQITTFASTGQTAVQIVSGAMYLSAATAGPGGVFGTIGSARSSGTVLTISH